MLYYALTILTYVILQVHCNSCPIFSCGEVTNSVAGKTTCIAYDKKWNVSPCPNNQICNGNKFFTLEQATDQTFCTSKANGQKTPGDNCLNDSDCFQNLKCVDQKCKGNSVNGNCTDQFGRAEHRFCNKGLFCNSNKVCTNVTSKNSMCDSSKPCEFGTLCAKTLADTNFTCRELFKISDGTKIDVSKVYSTEYPSYSVEDLCQSGYIFINSFGTYCMHAPQSVDTDNDKRKRINGSGEKCNFTSYSNPSLPTQGEILTDYSQCGFNQGKEGYCDIRKGDKEFTTIYSTYKQLISNYTSSCHISSNIFDCYNSTGTSKEFKGEWAKAKYLTTKGSYAAIANNDRCVKSSITGEYWGYPDFSQLSFNLASCASIFILVGVLSILF